MARRPRILVVGSGPAGLAAAEHLLDVAGESIELELLTLGHHLGARPAPGTFRTAGSWSTAST